MKIKRFELSDFDMLENYLVEEYKKNQNMDSWLPQRLHDLVFRMSGQEIGNGKPFSYKRIFMWIENNKILSCILPDGDTIYFSISKGNEDLFPQMLEYAENNCTELFDKDEYSNINFCCCVNSKFEYQTKLLEEKGYIKDRACDYNNYIDPEKVFFPKTLDSRYSIINHYDNESLKWTTVHVSFHPELDIPGYRNKLTAYNSRKKSTIYNSSFECMIIDNENKSDNPLCSYTFCYVDPKTNTGFIEPVGVRKSYQRQQIGINMIHSVILTCKEFHVDRVFVNGYDWRTEFYNKCGFITESTMLFYHKNLKFIHKNM